MRTRLLIALAPLLGLPIAPAFADHECSPSYDKPDQIIADCTAFLSRNGLDDARRAAALQIRGDAFRTTKHVDRALADLAQGIRLDPSNAELYYDRASLYRFELADVERSFADINESIRLDPDSYPKLSFRGDIDVERNDLAAATTDFGGEIRLNPTGVGGYYSRGQVWVMRGEYKPALDDFEAGFKLSPDYSNIIKSRNRAHAALAVGAALARAEGMALGSTPNFRANPTKDLYSEVRSWKDGDALHHCTLEFDEDKTALAVGRGRSGYMLALASGQWSLSPGSSYPVQVSIGDGPSKQTTATVIDPITIAIPLTDDKDFVERTKGYAIPITIQAGQNTIKAPSPSVIDYAEKVEACWRKAITPAAESNPFGSPSVASTPSASLASNPFATAGRIAAKLGAAAAPARTITKP